MASLISETIDDEDSEVLEIITNYNGSSIYESKLERELLTSSEFRKKLWKVSFILRPPAD